MTQLPAQVAPRLAKLLSASAAGVARPTPTPTPIPTPNYLCHKQKPIYFYFPSLSPTLKASSDLEQVILDGASVKRNAAELD